MNNVDFMFSVRKISEGNRSRQNPVNATALIEKTAIHEDTNVSVSEKMDYGNNATFNGVVLVSISEAMVITLVREIADAKKKLNDAVSTYLNGARATIEIVTDIFNEKYRQMKKAKDHIKECEEYQKELVSLTINGTSSITDRGVVRYDHEYIRRSTRNHLAVLKTKFEDINFDSELITNAHNEYEKLVTQFVYIVSNWL